MLLTLFAGVFRYVDQHYHTPETFLENTSGLASNADVRERLLEGFRDEIIAIADGDLEETDDASGLDLDELLSDEDDVADPITEAINNRNEQIDLILLDILESEANEQAFESALTRTQQELIGAAELEPQELLRNDGEVFFNLQPLYEPIWASLAANELTAEITQVAPPPGSGVFKVADRSTTIDVLWTLLRGAPGWRGLATLGAIASLIGAVAIAERRPSTAIQFGIGVAGVCTVLVVVIYLIRFLVPLLSGGGTSGNAVVAVYATNLAPLVRQTLWLGAFGLALAAVGGIARAIWPDDWVYSSVSDERGVRSIRRRRGAEEPDSTTAQQQLQPAAMAPTYGGYPQPYPGYPQQWGQPYPGQYPPGYVTPYPVGPYAQPAQPGGQQAQHYTGPGKPTVPVMPVQVEQSGAPLVPPAAPPLDAVPSDLPPDAAQAVPRVVATTDSPGDDAPIVDSNATIVETSHHGADQPAKSADEAADEWSGENDW